VTDRGARFLCDRLAPGGVFVDVKTAFSRNAVPANVTYWSL